MAMGCSTDGRAAGLSIDGEVVLGDDRPAFDSTSLANVDLPGPVAVVDELLVVEADLAASSRERNRACGDRAAGTR